MKANFLTFGLLGLTGASAVLPRDSPADDVYPPKHDDYEPYTTQGSYDSYPTKDGYHTEPTGYPTTYDEYPTTKHDDYPTKKHDDYPWKKHDDYSTTDYSTTDYSTGYTYKNQQGSTSSWKPKSRSPEFFNLRVDEECDLTIPEDPTECPLSDYGIRLEGGIFIATPYSRLIDPALPTFFVDDDTQLYTVRNPLVNSYTASSAKPIRRSARTLFRSTSMESPVL
jgi:hypothetical protein